MRVLSLFDGIRGRACKDKFSAVLSTGQKQTLLD